MVEFKEVPINKLKPGKPDTGWYEPFGNAKICLMCDLFIHYPTLVRKKIDKCPNCGFALTPVKRIGLIAMDGTAHIITDTN